MLYEDIFPTKDFYSAVILRTTGHQINNVEKHRSGISIFVFRDPEKTAERTLISFWNRELQVEPRSFIEAINELKTRIHS